MSGLDSAWNLKKNVFSGRTEKYWFKFCANLPLLHMKFVTADNMILALFCKGSIFAPLIRMPTRCVFSILVSKGMVLPISPPSVSTAVGVEWLNEEKM